MQGFSKQHANKLIQQGHIILEDGLVDTEQADAALAAMRNPNKQIYRKHLSTGSTHQKADDEWLLNFYSCLSILAFKLLTFH
jgi:hypothetical protein